MQEILNLIHEMSPYLLLGFGIAGVMHTFVPTRLYHRYLSGRGFRSVLYAAALGVPLPLCSCGVLPTDVLRSVGLKPFVQGLLLWIVSASARCSISFGEGIGQRNR